MVSSSVKHLENLSLKVLKKMEYFLKSLEKVLKFRCQDGVATLASVQYVPVANMVKGYVLKIAQRSRRTPSIGCVLTVLHGNKFCSHIPQVQAEKSNEFRI